MKIEIKRLELTNFKCFKHKEITFNGDVTTIKGRNGVGKTTIADAILWCLFGKNTQGQADFDLKTHDENGKPIPNLDHSVEMRLFVGDGTSLSGEGSANLKVAWITIKRTLKETWIKKRGSDEQVFKNNTTEYLVNGDSYTAADYKKYIASLISEDVFKCITNPSYFPSLKWQEQRQFLTKLAGEINSKEIADSVELSSFATYLETQNEDVITHRKHLSYQIKQIKDKLEKIPVRLEEQNKALPESVDYDAVQMDIEQAQRNIKEVDEKILAIKSGNGGDLARNEIRNNIKDIQSIIDKIEETETKAYRLRQQDHDNNVYELSRKFNQLVSNQRDLESKIQSMDVLAKRCRETAEKTFKDEQADIRAKWPQTQAKFDIEKDGICPMCGQILPDEKLENVKEMFNIQVSNLKQQLTERAAKAKQLLADAEQEAKNYEDQKSDADKMLAETKEEINRVFSEKAKLEREPVISYEQELAYNKQYNELLKSREDLKKRLDSAGLNEEDEKHLASLEAMRVEYVDVLQQLNTKLATKAQYDKVQSLIAGIEQEQKDLVTQLSELERKEDIARRYQDRQNQILESRINEHFSLVKWKMFRTVNNGGDPFDEPFCECYVDGVAYHDGLNQAARLNAGLDIINTLCKHYNVSAPIVLDNAESTINIIPTIGQQIRLFVSDCDLTVE